MVKKYQVSTIQSDAKWLFFMVNLSYSEFGELPIIPFILDEAVSFRSVNCCDASELRPPGIFSLAESVVMG